MRGTVCVVTAVLGLFLLAGCHSGQVRLPVAPGTNSYVWVDRISPEECRGLYEGLAYEVKAPVGYATGRDQELERFIVNAHLRWNDAVSPLGGLFDDLCHDHNAGLVALSEFRKRKAQLTDADDALVGLRGQLDAALADYRSARQQEAENRGASGQDAAAAMAKARQRMDAASQKVEDIIKKATSLIGALKGPRAEGNAMAALQPPLAVRQ